MVSGTITDKSGRTLSGQTAGSVLEFGAHAKPADASASTARSARKICARTSPTSRRVADTLVVCLSERRPAQRVRRLRRDRRNTWRAWSASLRATGLVNIVGGCCGTTPEHIAAIAAAVAPHKPRIVPEIEPRLRLSGLEPFILTDAIPFVNVGERTNVTGSARFRKLITAGDYTAALQVARDQVENGAQIIDVNMDEGLLDSEAAMVTLPQPRRRRARHRPRPRDGRLLEIRGDRSRPEMRAGQAGRQLDLDEGRRREVHSTRRRSPGATAQPWS